MTGRSIRSGKPSHGEAISSRWKPLLYSFGSRPKRIALEARVVGRMLKSC
jgi:hypothetical protein